MAIQNIKFGSDNTPITTVNAKQFDNNSFYSSYVEYNQTTFAIINGLDTNINGQQCSKNQIITRWTTSTYNGNSAYYWSCMANDASRWLNFMTGVSYLPRPDNAAPAYGLIFNAGSYEFYRPLFDNGLYLVSTGIKPLLNNYFQNNIVAKEDKLDKSLSKLYYHAFTVKSGSSQVWNFLAISQYELGEYVSDPMYWNGYLNKIFSDSLIVYFRHKNDSSSRWWTLGCVALDKYDYGDDTSGETFTTILFDSTTGAGTCEEEHGLQFTPANYDHSSFWLRL